MKNIFFDLDGTVINSMEGIFNSIKYVIKSYNLKELDEKTLRTFIGPPLHNSFLNTFNVDFETADIFVSKYREYYSKKGIFEFSLYDGMKEMLKVLSEKYDLYITTSKPTDYAKMILEKEDILKYFKFVSGSEKDKPDSSKSQVVNYVTERFKLNKEDCVLIGDTKFDGEGATHVGIDFFGVSYGFGSIDELLEYNPVKIFNDTKEITDYFSRQRAIRTRL